MPPQSGLVQSGNVDLYAQPKVKNPDGTTSTVDSRSYNIDGHEVLLPSVTPDGRHLQTDDEIIREFTRTGRHLGKFDSVDAANAYASRLHDDYAAGKYDKPSKLVAQQDADPVVALLKGSKDLSDSQRAGLWSAYDLSKSPDDLTERLTAMQAPDTVKASLWNLKAGRAPMDGFDTSKPSDAAQSSSRSIADDSTALAGFGAAKAIPKSIEAAEHLATSPSVPKTAAAIGRVIGAVAPPVTGAMEGGPVGALAGLAASAKGSWLGGRTGWFTGKLLQNIALPIAEVLEKAKPYVQSMSTASGAQGVLDLAQMADPNRVDIGVLGISPSDASASQRAAVMSAQIKALKQQGLSTSEAASRVSNAWASFLREERKQAQ